MKGMRKISRGASFNGVMSYVADRDADHKDNPGALIGGNTSGISHEEIAKEMAAVSQTRPDIAKPVWHNSLRLPDGERASPEQWNRIADDYLKQMGFSEKHQRVIYLHDDKSGQHVHIVANRVGIDGSVYLGKNENLKSTRIIQGLEIKHGLQRTKGVDMDANGKMIKRDIVQPRKSEIEKALRTNEKPIRMQIQESIDRAFQEQPKDITELSAKLENYGIKVHATVQSGGKLSGIAYECEGITFKGSQLGQKYKAKTIEERLNVQARADTKFTESGSGARRLGQAASQSVGNGKPAQPQTQAKATNTVAGSGGQKLNGLGRLGGGVPGMSPSASSPKKKPLTQQDRDKAALEEMRQRTQQLGQTIGKLSLFFMAAFAARAAAIRATPKWAERTAQAPTDASMHARLHQYTVAATLGEPVSPEAEKKLQQMGVDARVIEAAKRMSAAERAELAAIRPLKHSELKKRDAANLARTQVGMGKTWTTQESTKLAMESTRRELQEQAKRATGQGQPAGAAPTNRPNKPSQQMR